MLADIFGKFPLVETCKHGFRADFSSSLQNNCSDYMSDYLVNVSHDKVLYGCFSFKCDDE